MSCDDSSSAIPNFCAMVSLFFTIIYRQIFLLQSGYDDWVDGLNDMLFPLVGLDDPADIGCLDLGIICKELFFQAKLELFMADVLIVDKAEFCESDYLTSLFC
jgi:hypothetical protein